MTSSSQHTSTNNAFVTLLTSDHYLPGALVLAESLRLSHGISRKGKHRADASTPSAPGFQVVALITPDTLSVQSVKALRRSGLFDWIVGVEPIGFRQILASSPPPGISIAGDENANASHPATLESDLHDKILEMERNLALLGRPDLTNTLTKLHAWRLGRDSADLIVHGTSATRDPTQTWQGFDKVVFLDADALVLRPIDHLFRLGSKVHFAAAPDTGWPDAFNSGVMMLTPSGQTFEAIRSFARTSGSWDGADQGLLNDFFGAEDGSEDAADESQDAAAAPGGGWKRLSFRYNVTSHGGYTFAPAYQRYGQSINIVHFIGQHKPWNRPRPSGIAQPSPLVGPRDLDSQPITPDQPDYLLAIWHSAFASLYPSSGSTSPDSEIEIVHTERGVEVVERRKFTVPTFHAVWDAEAREGSAHSANALGAAGLVPAHEAQSVREAAYASLPLDGRTSLIAPAPEVARTPSPPTPTQESIDAELRFREASGDPVAPALSASAPIAIPGRANADNGHDSDDSPQHFSPPKLSWNPAHEPPPSGSDASLHQMRTPIDAFYSNAWDAGQKTPRTLAEQKAAFFVPQGAASKQPGGRPQGGPGYIPAQLRRDRVFDNLGSQMPDSSKVKPVFPWETQQHTTIAPTRVFPDEPRRPSPPSSADTTPKLGSTQDGSFRAAAPATAPAPAPVQRPRGLPSNLSFVNAWDQAGAIGNFADAWSRHTQPSSPDRRRSRQPQANYSEASSRDPSFARHAERRRNGGGSNGSLRSDAPVTTFRPPSAILVARRSSSNDNEDARDGEASDSRDGDDESSEGEESSGHEEEAPPVPTEREATPSPTNSRQAGWPREGPGRGYMKKAENSVHAQMHATPRSPRLTSRVLSYASTATEGEGKSGGRFSSSSSSNTSTSTVTSERAAAARQRAKDRIRPDGWIATGSAGSGLSSPPPGYPSASSLRGIPGIGGVGSSRPTYNPAYPGMPGRRRETNSSNESQSGESGANSPTALLSPTIGTGFALGSSRSFVSAVPQPVPSRVPNPSSLDEPFSSSPVNLRSELTQQARTHRQAKFAGSGGRSSRP